MKIPQHFLMSLVIALPTVIIASHQEPTGSGDIITCSSTISPKGSMITYASPQRGIQVSSMPGAYFYVGTQRVITESGAVQIIPLENPSETFLELQKGWTVQHNIKVIAAVESPVVKKSSKRECSLL